MTLEDMSKKFEKPTREYCFGKLKFGRKYPQTAATSESDTPQTPATASRPVP